MAESAYRSSSASGTTTSTSTDTGSTTTSGPAATTAATTGATSGVAVTASTDSASAGNLGPAAAKSVSNGGIRVQMTSSNQTASDVNVVLKVEVPAPLVQSSFEFTVPSDASRMLTASVNAPQPSAKLANRSDLPAWLLFDPKSLTFSAKKVPPGGLPVTVEIQSGNVKIILQIDEMKE